MVAGQLFSPMSPTRPTIGSRPLRVLHCPDMVGGQPGILARAERELGAESWAVSFEKSRYDYPIDEIVSPPGTGPIRRFSRRWRLLWRALRRFDVVHFNFGRTITPERSFAPATGDPFRQLLKRIYLGLFELSDLPLLKSFGKAVFVTFQGDDLRRGDFAREHFGDEFIGELSAGYYSPESDAHKRWRLSRFSRHADGLYAVNPDLMFLLPETAKFLPYANIDLGEWPFSPRMSTSEVPLVIHAPTDRGVKGTRFVLEAVERLQAEGVPFRFQLVEGLTHAEARQLYDSADLAIDQLWLGWYGGLAVELMALGRPVICNIRDDGLKFLPTGMADDLPIIRADRDSLTSVLREWLTVRRSELPKRGELSRRYVERWHDPRKIAHRLIADYEAVLRH
jgi:glycosyltransferase involved in cell wall biosynthesis